MSGRNLAYLDLSALPAVGSALLSPRPSFVWAADGRRLLWANAAGVGFFGAADMDGLLERRFSETLPSTTQIARFARALALDAPRLERISFVANGRLQSLAASCTRIRLADGASAVLIALEAPRGAQPSVVERAERLADAVVGADCLVAILDASGDVVAASGGLDALTAAESAIEGLVAGIGRSPDRLFKRAIRVEDGRRPAGIARFELDGQPFHLLMVGPAEQVVLEPARVTPPVVEEEIPVSPAEVAEPAAPVLPEAASDPVADELTLTEVESVEPESVTEVAADTQGAITEPASEAAAVGPDSDISVAEPEIEVTESAATPDDASDARTPLSMADIVEAVSETSALIEPVEPVASDAGSQSRSIEEAMVEPVVETAAEPAFHFTPPTGPVRFVFQMDAAGRFSFVSPEFATVVGPVSAAIVGASWGDVAAARELDEKGAIAALIARRDTWSGATLSWPVDGVDQRVSVDLAALPAFSRDRAFEGYRGFGVIRPSEARREPPVPVEEKRSTVVTLPKPQPVAEPTNVVRLPRSSVTSGDVERLTMPEQDAFRRIAVALGAKVGPVDPVPPTPEADAPTVETPPVESVTSEVSAADPEAVATAAEPSAVGPSEEFVAAESQPELPTAEGPQSELPAIEEQPPEPEPAASDVASVEPVLAAATSQPANPIVEPPAPDAEAPRRAIEAAVPPVVSEPVADVPPSPPVPDPRLMADLASAGHKIAELEAILDTATDGVAVVDAEGRIVRINRSAEALFGVETGDVAGLPFTHLLAEESRKSALDYLEGLAQNGVASLLNDGREVIGRVPQGGLIPLFMTMGRLGETGKFCAVLRDITQWKNAEEELINARRAAETASMQKSDFLAKISHEIRTPLNAIIGFSEVMMEERFGPIGTDRYKEYLRDIHVSGAHLMSLLNDLLDLSKIEAGKMDLNFEAVALNEIVMECVALMQPQANRERIIIRTSLSSQVPSIVADPRSIRQIVLNLVSNAIKFTLAGGQVIVSTALEERGEVTLRIRDTGIGMSEKDVETALMPFRQVATSAKHRSGGTGLGLPLTKALVEANRAAFLIDSAVGQGTLIRVTFPSTRVLVG
ncbi:ATP-binding protein [Kaistia granuli]|uniref:ATP-binding protein n=1 Tax=Kaistia granuli TaxID=363259 RepID=UPI0003795621|nr:ATP-binding protein [Kaistia granuli]